MINSAYGKTIENLRKRINARLVNNAEDFLKYTSRPTYISYNIFGEDYAAIYETKSVFMELNLFLCLISQFMLGLMYFV